MCGIGGYFGGEYNHLTLQAGIRCLQHRGPDDSGYFVDEQQGIGLLHTRLSILDLSALSHQPMKLKSGSLIIVFNGEIYNFKTLRKELSKLGHTFSSHGDTEVIAALYLQYGTDLLPMLDGIFAFAIWDQCAGLLFLARDSFGVKPLYFAESPNSFVFSSELKGILAIEPALARNDEIDLEAVQRYLTYQWCPGQKTPLRSIKKLGPGESLLIRNGKIEKQWIWSSQPLQVSGIDNYEVGQAISKTRELLESAVHRQLVSDVPVGAFLSGGVDSSAIVAFASQLVPDIKCFSIDIEGGQESGFVDDLPYARHVAKKLGVELEVVKINSSEMARDFESMVYQLDEPLADPACLNVQYICRLAREHGIKVMLSGAGGDDIFSGYRRHDALRYHRALLPIRSLLKIFLNPFVRLSGVRIPSIRRLSKLLNVTDKDNLISLTNYFSWIDSRELEQLYSTELRSRLSESIASEPLERFLKSLPPDTADLNRLLALEQRFFLADHNLNYTDKMSMAEGVEVRVPFLDGALARFAASLPPNLKHRNGIGKWILREAVKDILPGDVIRRPKTGFGAPLRKWIVEDMREMIRDTLSIEGLARRGLFDPKGIQQLIEDNERGKRDASYTIFAILCMELWCRKYIDGT